MKRKIYYVLVVSLIWNFALPTKAQVTTNILSRVFIIKYRGNTGTAFTIEVQDRQYLITARHIVNGIKDGDNIEILQNNALKTIAVKPLYTEPSEVDIVVLVPPAQISPALPLEPTMDGLLVAQDMFFLGFPFGIRMEVGALNNGFPFPLIKSGIASGVIPSPAKDYSMIFVDGLNNPGFSGGPIVFFDQKTRALKVAAVIAGYRNQEDKVFRKAPKPNKKPGEEDRLIETDMITKSNTGIVIGFNIKSAVDVILKNPIGPLVKK